MKKLTPSFPVVFDHIFKTAGTSIHKYFLDSFDNEFVPAKIAGTYYADLLDHVKIGNVVCAHLIPRPGDDILIECNYTVTILRDPLERLYSQYRFIRADFNAGSKYYQEAIALSPEQYFFDRGETSARFHNAYLNHFIQAHTHYSPNLPKEDALALAREVMDHYAVIGIVPKIDEFLCLIAADLGILPPEKTPRENVNSQAVDDVRFPSSLKERLVEANAADFELYQYAHAVYLNTLSQRLKSTSNLHFPSPKSVIPAVAKAPGKINELILQPTGAEIISGKVFQEDNWNDPIAIWQKTFVVLTFRVSHVLSALNPAFKISDSAGRTIYQSSLSDHGYQVSKHGVGEYCLIATFKNSLGAGLYYLSGGLFESMPFESKCWCWIDKLYLFNSGFTSDQETFKGVVALQPELFLYPIQKRSKAIDVSVRDFHAASGCYGRDVLSSLSEFPPSQTFPFNHLALRTEVGALKDDGVYTTLAAGYLIFGPYLTVLPGYYRIDVDITDVGTQSEAEITIDICGEDGEIVIMEPRNLQFASNLPKSICFSLDRVTRHLEIRIFVTARTKAVFKQYRLQHLF